VRLCRTIRRWLHKFRLSRYRLSALSGIVVGYCFAFVLGVVCLQGQTFKPSEYQVKSVYLYNFGKFVEWPRTAAAAGSPSFVICVLGEDPFGPILNTTLAGETVSGKRPEARRVASVQDANDCHILYISTSEQRRLGQVLTYLNGKSVLTVSDMEQFSDRGGIIQFVWDRDRVRFEVNLAAATKAGLTLSSELLKVAARVRQNP